MPNADVVAVIARLMARLERTERLLKQRREALEALLREVCDTDAGRQQTAPSLPSARKFTQR